MTASSLQPGCRWWEVGGRPHTASGWVITQSIWSLTWAHLGVGSSLGAFKAGICSRWRLLQEVRSGLSGGAARIHDLCSHLLAELWLHWWLHESCDLTMVSLRIARDLWHHCGCSGLQVNHDLASCTRDCTWLVICNFTHDCTYFVTYLWFPLWLHATNILFTTITVALDKLTTQLWQTSWLLMTWYRTGNMFVIALDGLWPNRGYSRDCTWPVY